MIGIQYLTDESGVRTSVLIDLKEWGEQWEDFYDGIIAESRKDEPTTSWQEFEDELDQLNSVRS